MRRVGARQSSLRSCWAETILRHRRLLLRLPFSRHRIITEPLLICNLYVLSSRDIETTIKEQPMLEIVLQNNLQYSFHKISATYIQIGSFRNKLSSNTPVYYAYHTITQHKLSSPLHFSIPAPCPSISTCFLRLE